MTRHREAILLAVTKARIEKEPMAIILYPICEKDENGALTWSTDADFEWTMFGFQNIKHCDIAEWLRHIAGALEETYGPEEAS